MLISKSKVNFDLNTREPLYILVSKGSTFCDKNNWLRIYVGGLGFSLGKSKSFECLVFALNPEPFERFQACADSLANKYDVECFAETKNTRGQWAKFLSV